MEATKEMLVAYLNSCLDKNMKLGFFKVEHLLRFGSKGVRNRLECLLPEKEEQIKHCIERIEEGYKQEKQELEEILAPLEELERLEAKDNSTTV